jgi:hypothetical protein
VIGNVGAEGDLGGTQLAPDGLAELCGSDADRGSALRACEAGQWLKDSQLGKRANDSRLVGRVAASAEGLRRPLTLVRAGRAGELRSAGAVGTAQDLADDLPGGGLDAGLAAAKSLARAGDTDQAEAAARALSSPHWQQHALAEVAVAAARAGDFARAEQITRSVTGPVWRGLALAALAAALAAEPGTLEPQTGRADPADGGIVPAQIADNPAGAKLGELLAAALDEAPPNYDGILPVLTRLAPAAVIRAARDCSAG